jgi:YidC/Oxa1 family membrane protein insertase
MAAFFTGNDGELSPEASTEPDERANTFMTSALAAALAFAPAAALAVAPAMYKVDKTGPIGFLASFIETLIDKVHEVLSGAGIEGSYGFGIIVLTLLVKVVTAPLLSIQLESTTKMQKLKPIQDQINKAYTQKENQQKNEIIARLFQTANVNPLAGCLPAFAQIPVFISLYRALQNLIAEDKLQEGFLWIPTLEGPISEEGGLSWLTSSFTGNPVWGYQGTLQFLSLAVILYVCQTISLKLAEVPRADPDAPLTEAEQTQKLVSTILPLTLTAFSLNVPAGLSVYWISNSILTTALTVTLRQKFKNVELPPEVQRIQEMVDRKSGSMAKTVRLSGAYSSIKKTREAAKPSAPSPTVSGVSAESFSIDTEDTVDTAADDQAKEASFDAPVAAEMKKKKKKKGKKNKKR